MRILRNIAIILVMSLTAAAAYAQSSINPVKLTCEYSQEAVIDIQNPRLSWVNSNKGQVEGAAQTAYRIRVSLSPDNFRKPLWDTGKVRSDESVLIEYKGKELPSRTTVWWQVKVWDEKGKASEWSEPASWHMGMLDQSEWQGKWIGAPWQGNDSYDVMTKTNDRYTVDNISFDSEAAPLLRKSFNVGKAVREARFYGTGLGYFELYFN